MVESEDTIGPTQTVSAERTEEDLSNECGDVPDEDEISNVNIGGAEKETTYLFEEDGEAEEALRNMHIEGEPSKASKPNEEQESMDKVSIL